MVRKPIEAIAGQPKDKGMNVVVGQKSYFFPYAEIPFENLTPDPRNPRYRFELEHAGDGGLSPDKMYEILTTLNEKDTTFCLANSIEQAGGLVEPVIVEMVDETHGVIREGIRRWAAIRMLRERDALRWKRIACHVVPDTMDVKALTIYIGLVHYQGKKEWSAHSKAGYIHQMRHVQKMTNADIAAVLGISKAAVELTLKTFIHSTAIAKEFKIEPPWSKVHEFLKKKGATPLLKNEKTRRQVYQAIVAVPEVKAARNIPMIMENAKATAALLGNHPDGYKSAVAIVEDRNPAAVGVFRLMQRAAKDFQAGYADALAFLQKPRGNRQHVEIYKGVLEVLLRLAKDSHRVSTVKAVMKQISANTRKGQNGSVGRKSVLAEQVKK